MSDNDNDNNNNNNNNNNNSNNKSLLATPQGAFQCHFTCKYRVSILRVLDSLQQWLTYIFDINY